MSPHQFLKSQQIFKDRDYVSLEDPDTRDYANTDPRGFLSQYPQGAIFDEVQQCPDLFSYIQTIVDKEKKNGFFILTGSQHFLLMSSITQSLAGRTAILNLLPLSLEELHQHGIEHSLEEHIFRGFYPRLHQEDISPLDLYPNYLETYIQRDIRTLKNVSDLHIFHRFIKLLAGRTGQLINHTSLGNDVGVSHTTIKDWLSLLETSFIIYPISPHYSNFNKRIVKAPKYYFYDVGLLCNLLDIKQVSDYRIHFLRGGIFENFIINEVKKNYFNQGLKHDLYFWRDKSGHEIDLLIENGNTTKIYEIKSSETYNHSFIKNIEYYNRISGKKNQCFVINAGSINQKRTYFNVVSWKHIINTLDF